MDFLIKGLVALSLIATAFPASAANNRIDQETAASAIGSTDLFLCEQNVGTTNNTKKCTAAQVGTFVAGTFGTYTTPGIAYVASTGGNPLGAVTYTGPVSFNTATGVLAVAALPTAGGTLTGELVTVASASANAGLNIPHGAAPTSPVNGDFWTTTSGVYARINGTTVGPLAAGGSGTVGNCTTADSVAYYASTGTATSCLSSVGTSGQVLTSNGTGAPPTWQPSSGGGGLSCPTGFTATVGSCIWTQTASASSSLSWTGLTGNAYTLECDNVTGGNSTVQLAVQYGEGGTPTWGTASAYVYEGIYTQNAGAASGDGNGAAKAGVYGPYQPNTSGPGWMYKADFGNLQSTTLTKFAKYWGAGTSGTAVYYMIEGAAWYTTDTNAVTALRLLDIQGTPSTFSGKCTLIAKF